MGFDGSKFSVTSWNFEIQRELIYQSEMCKSNSSFFVFYRLIPGSLLTYKDLCVYLNALMKAEFCDTSRLLQNQSRALNCAKPLTCWGFLGVFSCFSPAFLPRRSCAKSNFPVNLVWCGSRDLHIHSGLIKVGGNTEWHWLQISPGDFKKTPINNPVEMDTSPLGVAVGEPECLI